MALNQLGPFQFVSFRNRSSRFGAPEIIRQKTSTTQRPGTDGTGIILEGIKAPKFHMHSAVDVLSMAGAALLHAQYTTLIGAPAQLITWGGIVYANLNTAYSVLEVSDPDITRIATAAGGFHGSAGQALMRITWTLQPIAITPP